MSNGLRIVKVIVNDAVIEYAIEGQVKNGINSVLLLSEKDLTKNTNWFKQGYTIQPFLTDSEFTLLVDYITNLVYNSLIANGVNVPADFALADYHLYAESDELHYAIISGLHNGVDVKKLPISIKRIIKVVSGACNTNLTARNPSTLRNIFNVRIIRPGRFYDNNPPHRDVYLARLKNAVNIYVPIAGSDANSSLALVPESQYWNEHDIEYTQSGAIINTKKFTVSAVLSYKGNSIKMIRPNPGYNKVMVFSPYLVHGAGYNLNADKTRVSLEMRFWQPTLISRILDGIS